MYEAKGVVLVQYRGSGLSALGVSDFNRSEQLAATYKRLITAQPFLERVSDRDDVDLSINQLSSSLSAEYPVGGHYRCIFVNFNSNNSREYERYCSFPGTTYA